MADIKQLFRDLKNRVSSAEQESEQLDREEQQEMKYLEKDDISQSLKIFSEEVELAVALTDDLLEAEEDEIQAEKIFKEKKGQIPEEIRNRFQQSEQKIEDLVEHTEEEMQILKKEAEQLGNKIQQNTSREELQNYRQDRNKLKKALGKMQEVENEENTMINRRNFLAATAATVAGAEIGTSISMTGQIRNQVKQITAEKRREFENTQSATRKEASKPNAEVKGGDGKLVEQIQLGELDAQVNVLRTSPDTAITYIEVKNTSNQSKKLEIDLSVSGWDITGRINFSSAGGYGSQTKTELAPGDNFEAGAMMMRTQKSSGRIMYYLETPSQSFKEIQLNVPTGKSPNITEPGKIPGLKINYQRKDGGNRGQYKLQLAIENTSGGNIRLQSSMIIPSGWSVSGIENVDTSGAGMYSINSELGNRDSDGFNLYVNRESRNAANIAVLTLTVIPEDQPGKTKDYIAPVTLEKQG